MAGIYLHIPFCKQACHYCDFHFSTNLKNTDELVQAMLRELELQQAYIGNEKIKTIYFGGGTPSLLSAAAIASILDTIRQHYSVDAHAEITLEANPDDLTKTKLHELKHQGVNRLSIGIQSFSNSVLQYLHRAHDAQSASDSVELARATGFDNISIDLIYAIPGQSDAEWLQNIQQALALSPEHISSYSLTIEDKTVFGRWAAAGKLKILEDEVAAAQLELLVETLEAAGYEQYEVSNFARPSFQSQHNSSYWRQEKYLGIGPSAHSFNHVTRQYNVTNNHAYVRSLAEDKIPATTEVLERQDQINDFLLTTLRTSWGADLARLYALYQHDLVAANKVYLQSLQENELAVLRDNSLVLTKRGRLLADKIASDLFVIS
jgi:oxygen-independent coproporphyrinogen-3 oxidase